MLLGTTSLLLENDENGRFSPCFYIGLELHSCSQLDVCERGEAGGCWRAELRLGLRAGLLPVSHRMWGILSGSGGAGRPASKARGSGQGMESGSQDRGRRYAGAETQKPAAVNFSLLNSSQFNMNSGSTKQ